MRALRDFECDRCGRRVEIFAVERLIFSDNDACGGTFREVWLKAPGVGTLGAEGSDRQVVALRRSYRQRFVKKELDDVRHRHGRAVDDALRGAAVRRIKGRR